MTGKTFGIVSLSAPLSVSSPAGTRVYRSLELRFSTKIQKRLDALMAQFARDFCAWRFTLRAVEAVAGLPPGAAEALDVDDLERILVAVEEFGATRLRPAPSGKIH